jgi:hypothetical protein
MGAELCSRMGLESGSFNAKTRHNKCLHNVAQQISFTKWKYGKTLPIFTLITAAERSMLMHQRIFSNYMWPPNRNYSVHQLKLLRDSNRFRQAVWNSNCSLQTGEPRTVGATNVSLRVGATYTGLRVGVTHMCLRVWATHTSLRVGDTHMRLTVGAPHRSLSGIYLHGSRSGSHPNEAE